MAEPTLEERAMAYVEVTRQHFVTYHHHKEQMAYVAAALYLTGISALILPKDMEWAKVFPICITFTLVILIGLLAILFVGWQLNKRSVANHIVLACDRLRRRWVESYPQSVDLPAMCAEYGGVTMPAFLRQEIDRMSPRHFVSLLPNTILLIVMLIWTAALFAKLYAIP